MPTETFANLSPEKQRRIFEAAVQEFAARRFAAASINQIIKSADISRGSFYQYFADKEDLYLYMLTEIGKEKQAVAAQTEALHPDADFTEGYLYMLRALLHWARERPLYYQIGLHMELDDSDFMARLRQRSAGGFAQLRAMIERDRQRGRLRPDADPDLIVEMVYAIGLHLTKEHYRTGAAEAVLVAKMARALQQLKEGITCVQGSESPLPLPQEP